MDGSILRLFLPWFFVFCFFFQISWLLCQEIYLDFVILQLWHGPPARWDPHCVTKSFLIALVQSPFCSYNVYSFASFSLCLGSALPSCHNSWLGGWIHKPKWHNHLAPSQCCPTWSSVAGWSVGLLLGVLVCCGLLIA